MSKVLALPLAAIKSSRVRGDIDGKLARKREIEEEISSQLEELEQIKNDLLLIFVKNGLDKVRMPDQTLISKMTKKTTFVSPEKLLEHQISLATIQECTVTNISDPFVRVDYPRDKKGESK